MRRGWTTLLPVAAVLVAACGADEDDPMLVLAAASLTEVFQELETAYEQANPGEDIELSFAGSGAVRLQIDEGVPADVVALADDVVMTELAGEGHVATSTVFATSGLVVAVPADGTAEVTGIESLADPSLLVGLCAVEVPCGRYASDGLAAAGVDPSVDTFESGARALTTKLALGELDAGVVYTTDVTALDGELVSVAPLDGVEATYPIAALVDAPHPERAAACVAFVLSPEARAILDAADFGTP